MSSGTRRRHLQPRPRRVHGCERRCVGDFEGLIRRLDYLDALGVDALWLAPFQPSPNKDSGYDVCDYYGVDRSFGCGGWAVLPTGSSAVLAMRYALRGRRIVVLHNFSGSAQRVQIRLSGDEGRLLANLVAGGRKPQWTRRRASPSAGTVRVSLVPRRRAQLFDSSRADRALRASAVVFLRCADQTPALR